MFLLVLAKRKLSKIYALKQEKPATVPPIIITIQFIDFGDAFEIDYYNQ